MGWFLYLLECVDGSIYTGIAIDVQKRYAQHLAGKGARYTRARPPQKLLAVKKFRDRSAASKAEYAVKQLSPAAKRAFCAKLGPPKVPKPKLRKAVKKSPARRPKAAEAL
ncbi:MAG: GIY-YIG nuclease family protein, partial [Proteobacteria bacterium]